MNMIWRKAQGSRRRAKEGKEAVIYGTFEYSPFQYSSTPSLQVVWSRLSPEEISWNEMEKTY